MPGNSHPTLAQEWQVPDLSSHDLDYGLNSRIVFQNQQGLFFCYSRFTNILRIFFSGKQIDRQAQVCERGYYINVWKPMLASSYKSGVQHAHAWKVHALVNHVQTTWSASFRCKLQNHMARTCIDRHTLTHNNRHDLWRTKTSVNPSGVCLARSYAHFRPVFFGSNSKIRLRRQATPFFQALTP